jgi:ABC-2 type transport system ATP-binding protein
LEGELKQPSLKVRGLARHFGDFVAVDQVDLEVYPHEFFALLGPNGAGKSTMIKMMTGLLTPTAGQVEILGKDLQQDPVAAKRVFGLLPEDSSLLERLSGSEYVQLVGRLHGLCEDQVLIRSEELLDLLELEDRDRLIVDYSLGMKKKVGLAAALVHAPKLLFLDEPFNGMDVITGRVVRRLLAQLVRKGVTIVFSSHVMEVVEKLCTRIAILQQGKIVALGTLEELQEQAGADQDLEELFLHYTGHVEEDVHEELTWMS